MGRNCRSTRFRRIDRGYPRGCGRQPGFVCAPLRRGPHTIAVLRCPRDVVAASVFVSCEPTAFVHTVAPGGARACGLVLLVIAYSLLDRARYVAPSLGSKTGRKPRYVAWHAAVTWIVSTALTSLIGC